MSRKDALAASFDRWPRLYNLANIFLLTLFFLLEDTLTFSQNILYSVYFDLFREGRSERGLMWVIKSSCECLNEIKEEEKKLFSLPRSYSEYLYINIHCMVYVSVSGYVSS